MNPMLIPSQFEALEQPEDSENVITIAADLDTSTQADSVIIQLGDVSHRQLHLNATLPQKAEAASLTSVIWCRHLASMGGGGADSAAGSGFASSGAVAVTTVFGSVWMPPFSALLRMTAEIRNGVSNFPAGSRVEPLKLLQLMAGVPGRAIFTIIPGTSDQMTQQRKTWISRSKLLSAKSANMFTMKR